MLIWTELADAMLNQIGTTKIPVKLKIDREAYIALTKQKQFSGFSRQYVDPIIQYLITAVLAKKLPW